MEKGFNDQELADIMSEIEDLEREFSDEAPAKEAKAEPQVVETQVEPEEAHISSPVLNELAHLPTTQSIKQKTPTKRATMSADKPAFALNVQGDMTVDFVFQVNGEKVTMNVTEEGLCIEVESGAKFVLPLQSKSAQKAA